VKGRRAFWLGVVVACEAAGVALYITGQLLGGLVFVIGGWAIAVLVGVRS